MRGGSVPSVKLCGSSAMQESIGSLAEEKPNSGLLVVAVHMPR